MRSPGAGYAPLVTGAPRDLRHIVRTEKLRLVLLDLVLPEVDGIELMRQVPRTRRPAGHLQLRLRPRRDRREGGPGALAIDYGRRRVTVGGVPVKLTATEYELLRVLSLAAGPGRGLRDAAAAGLAKRENTDANLEPVRRPSGR